MGRRIVMVVDELKDTPAIASITRNDLEGNSAEQTLRLEKSLQTLAPVICYSSVSEFEAHLKEHLNDIVFPMYYGPAGRNGKGMVPTLCEIYHIAYVGADPYTQLLCNDKALSKKYAACFGISSARSCLIRDIDVSPSICQKLATLSPPLVIKPNFGGGSTGISINNIVQSHEEAIALARQLLCDIQVPILIEEYVEGYEVELIVVGTRKEIRFCEEVQLLMGEKEYYDHDIWGFETKDVDDSEIDFRISNYISQTDRQHLLSLFSSFEKVEMIRFDGRIHNGRFYLLELSPDCYLGDDCAFYYAFQSKGYSHPEMLKFLMDNALNRD